MSIDKAKAQSDVDFLRRLFSPANDTPGERHFGQVYTFCGILFAIPLVFAWAAQNGLGTLPTNYWFWWKVFNTTVLFGSSVALSYRPTPSIRIRAANAIFAGAAVASLTVLVAFELTSHTLPGSHGVAFFVFQGAAWYAMWAIGKQALAALVAVGWLAFAVLLAFWVQLEYFVPISLAGYLLLMVLPGLLMARTPRQDEIGPPASPAL